MKKRLAFTMAEVLIALTIVGIVAALSVPTFMDNMHGKSNRAKYMKTISNLTQASTASYALMFYDFAGTNGYYGTVDTPQSTSKLPNGVEDGNDIIGYNTLSTSGADTFSDLHADTNSLFHIFHDHLELKHTKELQNYAVYPADNALNCAGRNESGKEVNIQLSGHQTIQTTIIKTEFLPRESYEGDVRQGSGGLAALCEGRSLAQGGINQGRMFMMADRSVFTYDPAQAYCSESNPCYGYIDINGPEGPNRVISCSTGDDSYITTYSRNAEQGMLQGNCTVKNGDITDIYPVLFYNQVVKPASWAAKAVYFRTGSNQIAIETSNDAEKIKTLP